MTQLDLRKQWRHLYAPPAGKVALVDVPEFKFLMLDGRIGPERAWLQGEALAGVAYDLLYINGESALPGSLAIEPEFKRLMFEGVR